MAKYCSGCSHPTICKTHGCGAEEYRRNAEAVPTSDEMLDWLEQMANQPGGLLLHSEYNTGRTGLGLGTTGLTLRQAIAQAIGCRAWERA